MIALAKYPNKPWNELTPNSMDFLHYKYILRCYLRAQYFYHLIQLNKKKTQKLIRKNFSEKVGLGLVYRQEACEIAWYGQLNAIAEFLVRKRLKPVGIKITDAKFVKALKERRDLDHHIIIDSVRHFKSHINSRVDHQVDSFQTDLEKFIILATKHFLGTGRMGKWDFDWAPESKLLYKKVVPIEA